jgi:hypothetical protein
MIDLVKSDPDLGHHIAARYIRSPFQSSGVDSITPIQLVARAQEIIQMPIGDVSFYTATKAIDMLSL